MARLEGRRRLGCGDNVGSMLESEAERGGSGAHGSEPGADEEGLAEVQVAADEHAFGRLPGTHQVQRGADALEEALRRLLR